MCALRNAVMTQPSQMAAIHRLKMMAKKAKKNVIQRTRTLEDMSALSLSTSTTPASEVTITRDDNDDEFFFSSDDESDSLTKSAGKPLALAVTVYLKICKQNECVPITAVKQGLLQEVLMCKFTKLQTSDLHSICVALCESHHVEELIFENNGIGATGSAILAELIQSSSFLTRICITENDLRSEGARIICEAVQQNGKIKLLDLSGNNLVESDGKYFKALLESCFSLRKLKLSNNCLSEAGVKQIADAIGKNCTLISLDLSWNHIRRQGATAICAALACNPGLETLNLAWNGLHVDGAEAIAKAMVKNDTLTELDLTCNRMSDICMVEIMKGLEKNTTLRTLRIGQNQITSNGALAILNHMQSNKASGITLLDLGRQEVHEKFEAIYEGIQQERDLKVVYGIVWQKKRKSLTASDSCEDEVALLSCDPLTVLMECMRLQNFRLLDYFKYLDVNKTNTICINELCDGMMRMNVPINRVTLMKLLARLDTNENSILDMGEMVVAQQEYKEKWHQSMAENVDYEDTDAGKVSMHLRRIMGRKFAMKNMENDALILTTPSNSRASICKIREMSKSYFEVDTKL